MLNEQTSVRIVKFEPQCLRDPYFLEDFPDDLDGLYFVGECVDGVYDLIPARLYPELVNLASQDILQNGPPLADVSSEDEETDTLDESEGVVELEPAPELEHEVTSDELSGSSNGVAGTSSESESAEFTWQDSSESIDSMCFKLVHLTQEDLTRFPSGDCCAQDGLSTVRVREDITRSQFIEKYLSVDAIQNHSIIVFGPNWDATEV